jgi:hypothetical protein
MGAYISLAFGWQGSFHDLSRLDDALSRAGLRPKASGQVAEGMHESSWELSFRGEEIPVTCYSYQKDGWIATTLDIPEKVFEEIGNRHGRRLLTEMIVEMGATLFRHLRLQYAFLDEEAEAEINPADYRADVLFGITLVAQNVEGVKQVCQRSDVIRCKTFNEGVVIYRRLDPVPHYSPYYSRV